MTSSFTNPADNVLSRVGHLDTKCAAHSPTCSKDLRPLHEKCNKFEALFGTPQPVSIESLLEGHSGRDREILLDWLIRCEIELRTDAGDVPTLEEYLARFPQDPAIVRRAWLNENEDPLEASAATTDTGDPSFQGLDLGAGQETANRPRRFGAYEILDEIARGGMGVVYRARHTSLQRVVALKVLLAGQFASESDVHRFRQETLAVAALDHPGVVPIYEVGEVAGMHYFSMPLLDGSSLADRIAEKPLPPRTAARIVETAARAVHSAHQHGIIHRDLKPRNILFDRDGHPKVADFGLAKLVAGDTASSDGSRCNAENTMTGQVLGTPAYMAPEQSRGSPQGVTAISDVYSLGAVLYASLTGRPPFQAATLLETIRQVQDDTVVMPRQLNAQIPVDLETIALKCLAKNPTDRYASAEALADDLDRYLADQPILARRAGWWERTCRWCRRNPRWAASLGTIAGLLVLITVSTTALSAWALREEAQGRARLFESMLSNARAITLSRTAGQRFRSLDILAEAQTLASRLDASDARKALLRNAAISALAQPDLYPEQSWEGFPEGSQNVDFDESLRIYARTGPKGTCTVHQVGDGRLIHVIPSPRPDIGFAIATLSRDGRFVAVRYYQRWPAKVPPLAVVWRIDGERPAKVIVRPDVSFLEFKPHGREIMFVTTGGEITRYNEETGEALGAPLPANTLRREVYVASHPTKPIIAVGSYFGKVVLIRDEISGNVLRRIPMPQGSSHAVWHPRGETLAIGRAADQGIQVLDAETFATRNTIPLRVGGISLSYSPAGDCLAATTWGDLVFLWNAADGRLIMAPPYLCGSEVIRFSRDGPRLAGCYQDRQLIVCQYSLGNECRKLQGPAHPAPYAECAMSVSPDGRLLAAATDAGIVFWDLESDMRCGFLPVEKPLSVCFEPTATPQGMEAAGRMSILVSDESGTYRWPIAVQTGASINFQFGPPQATRIPPSNRIGQSRDGRIVAASTRMVSGTEAWGGFWLFDTARQGEPEHYRRGDDVWGVAVSPDGQYLAVASYAYGSGELWGVKRRKVIREFQHSFTKPSFSPDGRWFMAGDRPARLWDARKWREIRQFDQAGCFSGDGRYLCLGAGQKAIRVVNIESGEEVCTLDDSRSEYIQDVNFAGNSRYVGAINLLSGISLWDLRLIRQGLADRGFGSPHFPAIPSSGKRQQTSHSASFEFDMGDWENLRKRTLAANLDRAVASAVDHPIAWRVRSLYRYSIGEDAGAISDMHEAVKRAEETGSRRLEARFHGELARLYVVAAPSLRDPHQAIRFAERAISLAPGEWDYSLTLGMAYYQTERIEEARTLLEECLRNSEGEIAARAMYFLAMCHARTGSTAIAHEHFTRAAAWHDEHIEDLAPETATELARMRREAEATLELSRSDPAE